MREVKTASEHGEQYDHSDHIAQRAHQTASELEEENPDAPRCQNANQNASHDQDPPRIRRPRWRATTRQRERFTKLISGIASRSITRLLSQMVKRRLPMGLIVNTFHRGLSVAGESSSKDMRRLVQMSQKPRGRFGNRPIRSIVNSSPLKMKTTS